MRRRALGSSGSEQGQVAGSYEHGNEHSYFTKCTEFLCTLDSQLLKDSVP